MKKVILLLSIVSIVFVSCKKEETKTKEAVKKIIKKEVVKNEPKKITEVIVWKGYKPLGSHTGTIDVKSSEFKLKDGVLAGGVFTFDMNTIKNNDIKDPSDKADLENHLKSADFFNVALHPISKFEITNVVSDKENKFKISGNLTMNGVTKEISFPASVEGETLKSEIIKIDRTDYGIKFKSKKFFDNLKDKFINDEFEISFKLKM